MRQSAYYIHLSSDSSRDGRQLQDLASTLREIAATDSEQARAVNPETGAFPAFDKHCRSGNNTNWIVRLLQHHAYLIPQSTRLAFVMPNKQVVTVFGQGSEWCIQQLPSTVFHPNLDHNAPQYLARLQQSYHLLVSYGLATWPNLEYFAHQPAKLRQLDRLVALIDIKTIGYDPVLPPQENVTRVNAFALDYDGCIGYVFPPKGGQIGNDEPIIQHMKKSLQPIGGAAARDTQSVIVSFSNRQSQIDDQTNAAKHDNGSSFSNLDQLAQQLHKQGFSLEVLRLLMTDLAYDLPAGTTWQSPSSEHRWFWDDSKMTILVALTHTLSSRYPHAQIKLEIFDDRSQSRAVHLAKLHRKGVEIDEYDPEVEKEVAKDDDILFRLAKLMQRYPALFPSNITVELIPYYDWPKIDPTDTIFSHFDTKQYEVLQDLRGSGQTLGRQQLKKLIDFINYGVGESNMKKANRDKRRQNIGLYNYFLLLTEKHNLSQAGQFRELIEHFIRQARTSEQPLADLLLDRRATASASADQEATQTQEGTRFLMFPPIGQAAAAGPSDAASAEDVREARPAGMS